MLSLRVRHRFEVTEVDGDERARGYQDHDKDGSRVLEPAAGPARAEVLDLISIDVEGGEMSFAGYEEGIVNGYLLFRDEMRTS